MKSYDLYMLMSAIFLSQAVDTQLAWWAAVGWFVLAVLCKIFERKTNHEGVDNQ